jgi:hypothetical protein
MKRVKNVLLAIFIISINLVNAFYQSWESQNSGLQNTSGGVQKISIVV